VTGAGLAWACTINAELDDLDPASGPPGTQVKVRGKYFPEQEMNGHVKVFLDATVDPETGKVTQEGRVLAEGDTDKWGCFPAGCTGTDTLWGPHTTIEIPRGLSLGAHTITAVGYDDDGYQGEDTQSFNVEPRKQPRGNGSGSDTPRDNTPRDISTPGATRPDRDSTRGPRAGGSPATSRSATSNRPTTGGSGSRATAPASRAGAPSPNGVAPKESSNPGLVTAPSGQSLFRDSMPPAALTDARRFGQPSGRSASGDLWSGFGSGKTPSLEPRRSDDPAAEEAGGFDLGLAAGTGFLGLGLAALFGSFLVAEVRRRRKAVRA